MDKKDILKNVYEDFFGIEKIERENEKLSREIEDLYQKNIDDIPTIEVKNDSKPKPTQEQIDIEYKNFIDRINKIYIDENSKTLFKKVIEYMKKYNQKIEKQYISFDMCVITNNNETLDQVVGVLLDAGTYFSYIKNGEAQTYSLYDIEDANQINDMYNEKSSIVVIKGFDGFNKLEEKIKNKIIIKLDENVKKNNNSIISILSAKSEEDLKTAFLGNEEVYQNFNDFNLVGINPDVQDVYQEILEKIKGNMNVTEDIQISLLDYISVTYPNNVLPYPDYRNNLVNSILFNKEIPKYENEKTIEEIFAELNSLVGLEKVKKMLNDLVNLIELKKKTENDLKIKNINLHMVFLGNPGTGKTTVARIISEMLYNLKYIKQNKLIEVSSKDLVAEYVGQTAPKTNAVIQKALGGVLFIDEAYSLASGSGQGNSFNEEAIATLIQAMENYRDDLVIIFAGYTKEMQAFLNANSGIVSRIGYTVEFDDYTPDELIEIFTQMVLKAGFKVTKEAIEKVRKLIDEYKDTKNFGNARFVRNIYEKSIVKHASNTKGQKSKKVLKTITEQDINDENLLKM